MNAPLVNCPRCGETHHDIVTTTHEPILFRYVLVPAGTAILELLRKRVIQDIHAVEDQRLLNLTH